MVFKPRCRSKSERRSFRASFGGVSAVPRQWVCMPLGVTGTRIGPRKAIQEKGVRPRVLIVFRPAIFMRQRTWREPREKGVRAKRGSGLNKCISAPSRPPEDPQVIHLFSPNPVLVLFFIPVLRMRTFQSSTYELQAAFCGTALRTGLASAVSAASGEMGLPSGCRSL